MRLHTNGSGTPRLDADEIELVGEARPLIVPGEYVGQIIRMDAPVAMYGDYRQFVHFRIERLLIVEDADETETLADGQPLYSKAEGVELFCPYNIEIRNDGRVACKQHGKLAADWSRVTGKRPRLDRISLTPLLGARVRFRVGTVIKDKDGDPLPRHLQYSRVSKILGRVPQ